MTQPSLGHITSPLVYSFYFVLKFTIILVFLLGLNKDEITCLPVQSAIGLTIDGGGMFIISQASAKYAKIEVNCSRLKNISLLVIRNEVVKKSWIKATIGSPLFGVIIFYLSPIKCKVSDLA